MNYHQAVDRVAQSMLRTHRNSNYSPEERAFDHACSYPSCHPMFKYWVSVGDRITALRKEAHEEPH